MARASSTPASPDTRSPGSSTRVGAGVTGWGAGDRVGVGWHGGHCGHCDPCRRGDFLVCQVAAPHPGDLVRRRPRRLHDRARGCPGPDSRGAERGRRRAADVRRSHDLQLAAPRGRAAWRPGGRARHRGTRPSGRAVRGQGRLPHGGHREGQGQGAAGPSARSASLHRQRVPGSGRGADAAGWRAGHPRDGDERQGDDGDHRRPRASTASWSFSAPPTSPSRSPRSRSSVAAGPLRAGPRDGRSTRRTRWPSALSPACAR